MLFSKLYKSVLGLKRKIVAMKSFTELIFYNKIMPKFFTIEILDNIVN